MRQKKRLRKLKSKIGVAMQKQKLDIKNLSVKQKKKLHIYLRATIQLLYFILLPSAFTAAFGGVKYIFTQIGLGKEVELTSFVTVLIVLCLYTIVFGRFFCGFACAFGTLGDAVRALYVWFSKKIKKKPVSINSKAAGYLSLIKYIILAAIVILCFKDFYSIMQGKSPWDVFSMLRVGNLRADRYMVGIIVLFFLVIGMCFQERFFCRFFCPMGAVFSILPVLPFFSLHRDRERCIKGCTACTKKCSSDIGLPCKGSLEGRGDCFQCQKCIDICPKSNIHCGIHELKGNEVLFTLFRAILLFCLLMWIGL